MKKAFVQFNLAVVFCTVLGCTAPSAEKKDDNDAMHIVENDLPFMHIRLLDQSEIDVRLLEGKIVLIFFQPDCDHCQREAIEIERNLGAFKNASLYFITSEAKEKAIRFAHDYKLNGVNAVYFGIATTESVLKNFGPIATPSIYIYSEDRKLVKAFNGEVEISAVLKYI